MFYIIDEGYKIHKVTDDEELAKDIATELNEDWYGLMYQVCSQAHYNKMIRSF